MRSLIGWTFGSAVVGYIVFGAIAGAFAHGGVTGNAPEAALAGGATFAALSFLGVVFRRLEERLLAPPQPAELPQARLIARR